jgi:hypothetical protein
MIDTDITLPPIGIKMDLARLHGWMDQAAHKETATATVSLKTRHDAQTNEGR